MTVSGAKMLASFLSVFETFGIALDFHVCFVIMAHDTTFVATFIDQTTTFFAPVFDVSLVTFHYHFRFCALTRNFYHFRTLCAFSKVTVFVTSVPAVHDIVTFI